MVGTAVYQVGWKSLSQSKKRGAWNPGGQTTLPPAARLASTPATSPWMWNSGIKFRHRSLSPSSSVSRMCAAEDTRFLWFNGTIFGREVVPEVWRISAMSAPSSSSVRPAPCPFGAPSRATVPLGGATQLQDFDSHPFGHAPRGRFHSLGEDQGAGPDVAQIEFEFLGSVPRIQRRNGSRRRHPQKRGGHLDPVGEHHRHAVAAADSRSPQTGDGPRDQIHQFPVAHRPALRRQKGGGLRPDGRLREK